MKYKSSCPVKKDRAIFLIRNYRDIFIRRTFEKAEGDDFYEKTYYDEGYDKYMSILKSYDEWCPDNRLMVYYEDLMSNPIEEIPKIFEFLGIDTKESKEFVDNYEQHFRCCLGIYRRAYPGGDLTVFPGSISKAIKCHMDDIMMYNSPILYGEYLTRYTAL